MGQHCAEAQVEMDPRQDIFPTPVDGANVLGLKAEYYSPIPDSCDVGLGSTRAFDGWKANITRLDDFLSFGRLEDFGLFRCVWERNGRGDLGYICNGNEAFRDSFAARWTGFLEIVNKGYYDFILDTYDGARLIIGNDDCPSNRCGTWGDVENLKFEELQGGSSSAYKKNCPDCGLALEGNCWTSDTGCEPYPMWQLEADGGGSGSCRIGPNVTTGRRWLQRGFHPIRLELFQRGHDARFIFRYCGPDTGGECNVPQRDKLRYPVFQGFLREWWAIPPETQFLPQRLSGGPPPGSNFLVRDVTTWGNSAPGQSEFSDYIVSLGMPLYVRWEGWLTITAEGVYQFRVSSDDGCRLILGGQGDRRERVVVNNDGLKLGAKPASGTQELQAGRHHMRVEWFWVPEGTSGSDTYRPPGLEVWYTGPDTLWLEESLTDQANRWITSEPFCTSKFFDRAGGNSVTVDCTGRCFDNFEFMVGDSVCDDGRSANTYDFLCDPWLNDNNDCLEQAPVFVTTPIPRIQCLHNPPAMEFMHHYFEACARPYANLCSLSELGGCVLDPADPLKCQFVECCMATLTGWEYWGEECYAYGVTEGWTCTTYLEHLLGLWRSIPLEDLELYARATPDNPAYGLVNGTVLSSCTANNCNSVPIEMVPHPQTGLPTEQRQCPLAEAEEDGLACFEGPWDVTGVENPFVECHVGYHWNFCFSRKTPEGKPLARCCSFSFTNARRERTCMFYGVPAGATCELYAEVYQENVSYNLYTAISDVFIKYDCAGEMCNDPNVESESFTENGCPHVVDTDPEVTRAARTDDSGRPPTYDEIIAGTTDGSGFYINWAVVATILAGLVLLAAFVYVLYLLATDPEILGITLEKPKGGKVMEMSKDPVHGWFHGPKAKVLCNDTFIDMEKDWQDGTGNYHVIKPREGALRQSLEDSRRLPRALRQDPAVVTPQVRALAQAEANRLLALEHELTAPLPPKPKKAPLPEYVPELKPFPQLPQFVAEEIVPKYTAEELEQMAREAEEAHRLEAEAAAAMKRALGESAATLALPGQAEGGDGGSDSDEPLALEDGSARQAPHERPAKLKPDALRPLAPLLDSWEAKYGKEYYKNIPRSLPARTEPRPELCPATGAETASEDGALSSSQLPKRRGGGP